MKALTEVISKNSRRKEEKLGATFKEKALSVFAFIIVFSFLAVIMEVASIYVTKKLSEFNQTYAFVNLLLLMNFVILLTKSIFESLNVLYFSRDLRILLRMPLKSKDILHAKLVNMIISEYMMEIIMLAIPIVVYGIYTKVAPLFYVYMICVLLVLPIIPIMLVSFIIAVIMRFTNMIKNKSKVLYITIIATVLIVSALTIALSSSDNLSFEEVVLNANGLAEKIANYFILIKPIMNTLLNYDNINGLFNFLIYLAESVVIYVVLLELMSKIYLKGAIGTVINSNIEKIDDKPLELADFKKKSKYKSYVYKELKTMIRTPIFCIQCLIMPLAYPLLVFFCIVFFLSFANEVGGDSLNRFYEGLRRASGLAIFLSIGQTLYMMNFSSIIAFSRESINAIMVKYLPLPLKKQLNLKISIGILTNMFSSFLVAITFYLCLKSPLNTLLLFAGLTLLNFIGEKYKVLIDLRNPQLKWDSEYTMMKQNTNVMYVLFYTFIVIMILVATSFMVQTTLMYLFAVVAATLIINTIIDEHIYQNQDEIFKKLF